MATTIPVPAAAKVMAETELANMLAVQALTDKFHADLVAMIEGDPIPGQYRSRMRDVANGMVSNIQYRVKDELPAIVRELQTAVTDATPAE